MNLEIEFIEDELKKPLPVEKLSWRVGQKSKDKKKAMMLVYIDSRDVQDRFDEACGIGNWNCEHKSINNRNICRIGIKIKGEWVYKEDGAGDTSFEAEKGGLSDAFKRCAVLWGVGRYLYNASEFNTWVNGLDSKGELVPDYNLYKNNKEQLDKVATEISRTVKPSLDKRINNFAEYVKNSTIEVLSSENFKQNFNNLLSVVSYNKGIELVKLLEEKQGE